MNHCHMATASDCIGCNNQIPSNGTEMGTDESNEKPLEAKQLELMDVNDDCLSAIFKRLSLLDLAVVADVCQRFRSLAQEDFWLTKRIVKMPQDVFRRKYKYDDEMGEIFQRASRIFRNFGSLMTALEVEYADRAHYDEKICTLIIKYASENLTALKLELSQIPSLPIGMKSIFNNLRKLNFYSRHKIDAAVPEWLTVIEDLTLRMDDGICIVFYNHSFSKLHRIHLDTEIISGYLLAKFTNKNKSLKEISLSMSAVVALIKIPTQIEKLHIRIKYKAFGYKSTFLCIDTSTFRDAKNLKSLKLCMDSNDDSLDSESEVRAILAEIIAGDIPLKHLHLGGHALKMTSERLCEDLSKLVHLETLKLDRLYYRSVSLVERLSPKLHCLNDLVLHNYHQLTADEMVTFVSCFPNLQRLKVHYCYRYRPATPILFDSKSFERLVAIVQNRDIHTRLDIALDACAYKLFIPNDIAKQHRHCVTVEYYFADAVYLY